MHVYLPKLGMAMEEGTIVEWLVANGDRVEVGQPLYTVNNDKVDTEIECPCAGTVRLLVSVGETHPIGTPVAEVEP
ncbi:MAG: biotin/lipoyl attachment protein [Acidimicrobiales bacterium]|nr:biotin/lipoyl attachment protein [Acidimicrobiales bacterium]